MSEQPAEPVAFPTVQSDSTGERTQVWPWYTTALVWIALVALLVPVSILLTRPTLFGSIGERGVLFDDPEWGLPVSLAAAGVALLVGWWVAKQDGATTSRTDLALAILLLPIVGLGGFIIALSPFAVGMPPLEEVPVAALVTYPFVALLTLFGGARLLGRRTRRSLQIPVIAALGSSLLLLPATLPTEAGYTIWLPKLSFVPILAGLLAPRIFGLEADPSREDSTPMRFFGGCFLFTVGTTIVMSFAGHAGLALVG